MGLVYATLELTNGYDAIRHRKGIIEPSDVKSIGISALVDSGAYMLVIPEHLRLQLDLDILGEREVELADGSVLKVNVAGPIEVQFENRLSITNALIAGNEVLLGAIPMEEMDVIISPRQKRLMVNPESPYLPRVKVK